MGKGKKKKDEQSDDEDDKKNKKKDSKKKKKDKKKKDKTKKDKKKKKDSSSSSSSSGSDSGSGDEKKAKKQKTVENGEPEGELIPIVTPPKHNLHLAPPEDGILRFEFTNEEQGPLGVRFGSGFPPLILSVTTDSWAGKKKVPAAHEVHAINGLALIPQNKEVVMPCLKARPVTLDIRPQGWKPPDKVKEINMKAAKEKAEIDALKEVEMARRTRVAKDKKEQEEIDAAELAVRKEKEGELHAQAVTLAKEKRAANRAKSQEFEDTINSDPADLRAAANALMEASYGSAVANSACIPLRLFTRRKEVAWIWMGEAIELIGGGINEDDDSWDA